MYRRICENLSILTALNLTRTLYTTARNYVNKLVNSKNTVFYKTKIQNADNKQMFTIVKSLISPKENNIPYFSSMQEGCTRFSDYFTNKTRLLLSKIDNAQHTLDGETQLYTETLNSFTNTNTMHVLELLKSTKKTCGLDPLPSSVLNECFHVLSSIITQIINMSISHGQVPILLKEATVRPLLKKPSLDIDVLAHSK